MAASPNQPGGDRLEDMLQATDDVPFSEHEAHLLTNERLGAQEVAQARESHVNWATISRATTDLERLGVRQEIQDVLGAGTVAAQDILDKRVSMRMFHWVKDNAPLGFFASRIGMLRQSRQERHFRNVFGTSVEDATVATMIRALAGAGAPAGLQPEFTRVLKEETLKMQMANLTDPAVLHDYLGQLENPAATWGPVTPIGLAPAPGAPAPVPAQDDLHPAPVAASDFAHNIRVRLRNILDYDGFLRSVGFDSYSKALAIELARHMDNPALLPGTHMQTLEAILANLEQRIEDEGANNDAAKEIDSMGENMVSQIENLSELYAQAEQLNVDFVDAKRGLAAVGAARGGGRTDTRAKQEAQWQSRIDTANQKRSALYDKLKAAEKGFVEFADSSLEKMEITAGTGSFLEDLRARIDSNAMVTSAKRTLFPTFEPVPAAGAAINTTTGTYIKAYIESVYPGGLEGNAAAGFAPTPAPGGGGGQMQIANLREAISEQKRRSSSIQPARLLYHLKYAMHDAFPNGLPNPNQIADPNERERVALLEAKMMEMEVSSRELHQSMNEKIAKLVAVNQFGVGAALYHKTLTDEIQKGSMKAQQAIARTAHNLGLPTLADLSPYSSRQQIREILGSSKNPVTPKNLEEFAVLLERKFKGFDVDGRYEGVEFIKENPYLGQLIYLLKKIGAELGLTRVMHVVNESGPDESAREREISRVFEAQRSMSDAESWQFFDEKFRHTFGIEGDQAMDKALTNAKKRIREEMPWLGEHSVMLTLYPMVASWLPEWVPFRGKRAKRIHEIYREEMDKVEARGAYETMGVRENAFRTTELKKILWLKMMHGPRHLFRDPMDEEHALVRYGGKVKGWYTWAKDKISRKK